MSSAALVSVLIPSAVAFGVYIIVFECLRPFYTKFFAPRFTGSDKGSYPYKGPFAWTWGIAFEDEATVLEKSGLDVCVYIRFTAMCSTVMFLFTIVGFLILVPVYATGGNGQDDLLKLGLSNVKQGSDRLWAPAVVMYVYTAIVVYLVQKNYTEIVELRKDAWKKVNSMFYTVLIKKIPDEFDNEGKIREFLAETYPDSIAHIKLVYNRDELDKKTVELQKNQLNLLVAKKKDDESDEPTTVKTGWCGLMGETEVAVPYYTKLLEEQSTEIETKIKPEKKEDFCNAAFVTFKTIKKATVCSGTRIVQEENWETSPATMPTDIIWSNLCSVKPDAIKSNIELTVNCALFGLIVFWAIPMSFGGALANLEQLGNDVSWLSGVKDLPAPVIGIIEGFGPTVWRIVLMLLLKPIIYALLKITGFTEYSAMDLKFVGTYYTFLIVNVYFITLVSSSIFGTIGEIVNDPVSIFQLLGEAIPAVAIEMIQYMILQGLGVSAQTIVRLVPLVLTIFFTKMATVDYQVKKAETPPPALYAENLCQPLLMWTICMAYAAVSPLILPFGWIFFFADYLIQKYQLFHVHLPPYETYGSFWPEIANTALHGMVLAQVALMAIVGLKFGAFQQILLVPLPFFTWFYAIHLDDKYGKELRGRDLPLKLAESLDKQTNQDDVMKFLDETDRLQMWAQPCVQVDTKDPLADPPEMPELRADDAKGIKGGLEKRSSVGVDDAKVTYGSLAAMEQGEKKEETAALGAKEGTG